MKDRQYLLSLYKKAKKKGLDINKYNTLKQQIADVEYDLRRLHDPLYLRMSPNATNSYKIDGLHVKHFKRNKTNVTSVSQLADFAAEDVKPTNSFGNLTEILKAATKKFQK